VVHGVLLLLVGLGLLKLVPMPRDCHSVSLLIEELHLNADSRLFHVLGRWRGLSVCVMRDGVGERVWTRGVDELPFELYELIEGDGYTNRRTAAEPAHCGLSRQPIEAAYIPITKAYTNA
jgi:hypothetical protein